MTFEDKILNEDFDLECPYAKILANDLLYSDYLEIECELRSQELQDPYGGVGPGLCNHNDNLHCSYYKNEIYRMIK